MCRSTNPLPFEWQILVEQDADAAVRRAWTECTNSMTVGFVAAEYFPDCRGVARGARVRTIEELDHRFGCSWFDAKRTLGISGSAFVAAAIRKAVPTLTLAVVLRTVV